MFPLKLQSGHIACFIILLCAFCAQPSEQFYSMHASDKHLVFAGACNKEDVNFCSKIVQNSVCNTAKNECFCRKGYVAVKEDDTVSCKTLLTDLKCRVDADCVHMNRSSCHPGAGFCTCPGSTVFVPQLSACRTRVFEESSLACVSCGQEGGDCYALTADDVTKSVHRNITERFGCACPNSRTNTRFSDPGRPQRICGAHLVDIGDVCNNEDLVCRSQTASCKPTGSGELQASLVSGGRFTKALSNVLIGSCQCPSDSVAIYQKLLQYYECFPKVDVSEPRCQNCLRSGGECYRVSEKQFSCKCATGFSSFPTEPRASDRQCSFKHVHATCQNGYLVVCFQPFWEAPYETLISRLENGFADARLAFSGFADSSLSQCSLTAMNLFDDRVLNFANEAAELWRSIFLRLSAQAALPGSVNRKPYCLQLDLVKMTYACGIRIYQLQGGKREYQGLLEVLTDKSVYNPSKDFQIPFKCIDPRISRHREERLVQNIQTNVTMTVLTEDNSRPLGTVTEGEQITLKFVLYSQNSQESISVKQCHCTNTVAQFTNENSQFDFQIYAAGCPVSEQVYQIKFEPDQITGRELQTKPFSAFRLEQSSSLFIRCSVRLCRHGHTCIAQKNECTGNSDGTIKENQLSEGPLIERWVHLNLAQRDRGLSRTNKAQSQFNQQFGLDTFSPGVESACNFAVCLTQAQLVVIAIIAIIVFITVAIIALLALRRKHFLSRAGTCDTSSHSLRANYTPKPRFDDSKNQPRRNPNRQQHLFSTAPYEYVNWSTQLAEHPPQQQRRSSTQPQPNLSMNGAFAPTNWTETPILQPVVISETLSQRTQTTNTSSSYRNSTPVYTSGSLGPNHQSQSVYIPDIVPQRKSDEVLLPVAKTSVRASTQEAVETFVKNQSTRARPSLFSGEDTNLDIGLPGLMEINKCHRDTCTPHLKVNLERNNYNDGTSACSSSLRLQNPFLDYKTYGDSIQLFNTASQSATPEDAGFYAPYLFVQSTLGHATNSTATRTHPVNNPVIASDVQSKGSVKSQVVAVTNTTQSSLSTVPTNCLIIGNKTQILIEPAAKNAYEEVAKTCKLRSPTVFVGNRAGSGGGALGIGAEGGAGGGTFEQSLSLKKLKYIQQELSNRNSNFLDNISIAKSFPNVVTTVSLMTGNSGDHDFSDSLVTSNSSSSSNPKNCMNRSVPLLLNILGDNKSTVAEEEEQL